MCGLALDFCVLDTCVNAHLADFESVVLIADASRPAHIPGVGSYGSGFLSEPAEVLSKMTSAGLLYASFEQLIPSATMASLSRELTTNFFPESLGPLDLQMSGLAQATTYLPAESAYTIDLSFTKNLATLAALGFQNRGRCFKKARLPSGWTDAPPSAKSFCWAQPCVEAIRDRLLVD